MSTVSQIPSSNSEAEEFSLPAGEEPLQGVLARSPEDLVPADQLPSAAEALAALFPPDEPSVPEAPAHAPVPLSAVTLGDGPAEAVAPAVLTMPDEIQAGEQFADTSIQPGKPEGDLQANSGSVSSMAVFSEGSPDAVATLTDNQAVADASSPSPSTELSSRGSGEMNQSRGQGKSIFSGFAAIKGSLLKSVSAMFTPPKRRISVRQQPNIAEVAATEAPHTVEAVETAAREEVTLENHSEPVTMPHAEEKTEGESGIGLVAALATTQEPDAATSQPPQTESSEDIRMEIAPQPLPADERSLQASQFTAPKSEDAKIDGSGDGPRDIAPYQPVQGQSEDPTAVTDFSKTESYSECEDEAADASDDDHAIASAIERYANRTDPARALPLEPVENFAAHSQEFAVEKADLNAVLDIPRDLEPADAVPIYVVPAGQVPESENLPAPDRTSVASSCEPSATPGPTQNPANEIAGPAASAHPVRARSFRDWSFEEKLASHHEWIESKGTSGKKIDFAGADLEGNDLIGANLRYVDLRDANLRAADLLMADLRDTCLVRANFRDSCLVGTNLEAANLEGASLETSMGLVPHQLAGANLHEATLPPQILSFEALAEFKRTSRTVYGYFAAMISLSVVSWLIVWMTKDFQLITNSAILPFLHSSTAAAALPTVQFYLIAPFVLFIVYLVFHFHLQHLWDTVLELPAVFPDGHTLGENEPRIVVGLLRVHFRWMNQDAPSTRVIEKAISILLGYWIVPATLLFYWLRYLTLQEIHGTILQELLVVGAAGAALYSTTKVGRPAASWTLDENFIERALGKLRDINPVTPAVVLLGALTFLSAGTIVGVPHGKDRAPQFWAGSIRRWAPTALWSLGIDPYADLTEGVISTKPANWNGADDQVSRVIGARLNDSNFRYAQAYRVFLANAHLLHAKLQGAFLSQADLRGADLGQSDLRYAILDQAQMSHANLDRAVLDGANLSRSDLRASNLSYASLAGAALVDARVDGGTLYGAKLVSATMIRTNFEKADLRESHLDGANLEHVDMQGAYLWSAKLPGAHLNNAQLGSAIFVDADLRGADLRWAQLPGTVLTGADLTGALLDGADFRGAVGFGANQVCSAQSRKGLLLDDAMQTQVTAQCGTGN